MRKYVFCDITGELLRAEDAEPVCGEDFCDRCGDCLHCYGCDPCYGSGEEKDEHFWVVYE
jgi:hypothetical protein